MCVCENVLDNLSEDNTHNQDNPGCFQDGQEGKHCYQEGKKVIRMVPIPRMVTIPRTVTILSQDMLSYLEYRR